MLLTLGNAAPIQTAPGVTTGARVGAKLLDPLVNTTTDIDVPDSLLGDPDRLIAEVRTAFAMHSTADPTWLTVHGAPDGFAEVLREGFGLPPAPTGPVMLLTDAGRDFAMAQLSGSASATNVAKWIALTADDTAASVESTTLTGEITTASGGLVRAAGTYAHTGGTDTYTVSNTFTANENDSLPVTIAKVGLFSEASSGALVFETLLSTTATLSASGDTLAITWTVTI